MDFEKDQVLPVDRSKGGNWSLTMYDKDYFMVPAANGRHTIGRIKLEANELALIVRTYMPTAPILDGSYKLPDIERTS